MFTINIIAFLLLLTTPPEKHNNAVTTGPEQQRFLTIAGSDLGKPYEIMDGYAHVKTVEACFACRNAFGEAINGAFKEIETVAKKAGADAMINVSVQLVLYPQRTKSDEMGQVIIFGTLVKYKPEATK